MMMIIDIDYDIYYFDNDNGDNDDVTDDGDNDDVTLTLQ
jgi:hypothetical protein